MSRPLYQQIQVAVLDGVAGVVAALRFLTRLPLPRIGRRDHPERPPGLGRRPWPLVVAGGIIGLAAALLLLAADLVGLPSLVAAAIVATFLVVATGALHEDGLADTFDGFGGGATAERRLEIMRDSRIGTFGAAAVASALILRAATVAALLAASPSAAMGALVGAAAVARAAAVAILALLPPARPRGLAAGVGRPRMSGFVVSAVIAAVIALVAMIPSGEVLAALSGLAVAAVAIYCVAALSGRMIGGQTGDVAGAAAVVAELAFLIGCTAVAAHAVL